MLIVPAAVIGAALLSWVSCRRIAVIGLRGFSQVAPRPDRWHSAVTPSMGGVGFATATLIISAVMLLAFGIAPHRPFEAAVPAAALAMFIVGVLDDRFRLSPLLKLVSSLIVGALAVFVESASQGRSLPWPGTLIAVIWFSGVVHALNLLDNMDGAAAGVGIIAIAFLAGLFAPVFGGFVVLYLVAAIGGLAGFLCWNYKPAKLFMGDSGSLFLGGTLAAASLIPLTSPGSTAVSSVVVVALVLSVPLFDTGFVFVLRRLAGLNATRGGTDHVSHRLVSLGFSERSAVMILYLLGLVGGVIAWQIDRNGLQVGLPLAVLFGVALTLMGVYLARVKAYNAADFSALNQSAIGPLLKDLTFRWHAGQVLLDLVLISACYYAAYRVRFEGEEFSNFSRYFQLSLPVIIGCKLTSLYLSGLYDRDWDTFSLVDLFAVVSGVAGGSVLSILTVAYLYRLEGFSRAVFLIDGMLLFVAVSATRASFRVIGDAAKGGRRRARRVAVYGAGAGGHLLVREMRANARWDMQAVAFLDDDPFKRNRVILGVPVRGGVGDLERVIRSQRIDEVIISSEKIVGEQESAIRAGSAAAGARVRRLHVDIR
jgi:UDP-GlcNAc:undecaprenyl-phosphate/decaprenyl-phosphate GlcNAc-1-phosphate transferase